MNWLNYHHLFYFWTVAREGSIARATETLQLAQPTISAQIRALERALGHKLFAKKGRSLVLTTEGEAVFRYAEEIFSLGRELVETMRGHGSGDHQRLAIGVSDSLPKLTTYRLLEPALRIQPQPRLYLRFDKTDKLLAELSIHALDLVLTDRPMAPGVRVRAFNHLLGECSVTVFGVPELARRYRDNFPACLQQAPLIVPTSNAALRQSLDQWFDTNRIAPKIVAEVEDLAMLQVLGQQGLGLFVAPRVVEAEVTRQYSVEIVGRLEAVRERFFAISIERRLKHPAVLAISDAARRELFFERVRKD